MGMLNKVKGYENQEAYMERSLAVVEKMETLVKELLYVSKTDGKQRSEYKTIDFAELLRVQIADVTDLLSEKEISFLWIFLTKSCVKQTRRRWNEPFKMFYKCHSLFTEWRGNLYILVER